MDHISSKLDSATAVIDAKSLRTSDQASTPLRRDELQDMSECGSESHVKEPPKDAMLSRNEVLGAVQGSGVEAIVDDLVSDAALRDDLVDAETTSAVEKKVCIHTTLILIPQ